MFEQLGFTLAVLEPGKPTGMYHAESSQEDFLVLAGACLLLVEEEERGLRAWDFVHCPPGTRHTFVGTGDGPCVIFMTGARREDGTIAYPESEMARAQCGRRERNEQPARGVRVVWPLAPRPAGRLVPTALELRQLGSFRSGVSGQGGDSRTLAQARRSTLT